jgi:hypothetical protein
MQIMKVFGLMAGLTLIPQKGDVLPYVVGAFIVALLSLVLVRAFVWASRRPLLMRIGALVQIGGARLRSLGMQVPELPAGQAYPEHDLYELLAADNPDAAHSRYNSLVRRLVSFERALANASRMPSSARNVRAGASSGFRWSISRRRCSSAFCDSSSPCRSRTTCCWA